MSSCLVIQDKNNIFIGADSAMCIKSNDEYMRVSNEGKKIFRFDDKVVFCTGSAILSKIIIDNFKKSNEKTVEKLQEIAKCFAPLFNNDVEILVAMFKNSKSVVYQLSAYNNFKILERKIEDEGIGVYSACFKTQECFDLAVKNIQKGFDIYNVYENVYKELSCNEVGGKIKLYKLTPMGIAEFKPIDIDTNKYNCIEENSSFFNDFDFHMVNAEIIIGKLLLGEKLIIGDEQGQFTINGNGMTIKDQDNKVRLTLGINNGQAGLTMYDKEGKEVVLSDDGIVQRFQYEKADNLDASNPIYMPLKFDEGIKSIRTVELSLKLENFRAYEKGASAGGGINTTDAGGGLRTSANGGGTRTSSSGGGIQTSNAAKWDGYNDASTNLYLVENTQVGQGVYIHYDDFRHVHTLNTAHNHTVDTNHSHSVDTTHNHIVDTTHEHEIIHGIYKGTRPSNVGIYVNDVLVISNINGDMSINIEDKLRIGNNEIKITSDTLGRVSATLHCKVFASF